MRRRHPLPYLWMLTDERQGDALWPALKALPRGSGIILRHYGLSEDSRRAMFGAIRRIARARGLMLLLAGPPGQARRWHADGCYGTPSRRRDRAFIQIAPVHDLREIRHAERRGADLLMLSPLFATRSHPGAEFLGVERFSALARSTGLPVVALGGVRKRHRRILRRPGVQGWAGIDAFIRPRRTADQKRKAVPT